METAVEERDAGSVRSEGAAPVVDQQPVGTAPGDESPTGAAPATEASAGEAAASLRRRSSVAVVSLQRGESASGLPGRLAEQLRHTVVAVGLSLLVPPLLLLTEELVRLFSQALPNVRPSAPCGRLLMDENSTSCVIALVVGITFFHCGMGLVLVGPKRTAPHTLIGATAHALFLVWYSSLGQVGTLAHFVLCFSGIGLHIFVVTFSVKLKRRWRRAPRALKESVTYMALGVFFCVAASLYIVLSDRLNGLGGFAITGLGYPAFAGLVRLLLQLKLKAGARLDRLDLHGMITLMLAIVFLGPQFYVLTSMQPTLSFLSSAVCNVAAELVGSALFARTARERKPSTRVRPSERSASAIKAETVNDRTALASSLESERQGEAARDRRRQITRLFVATKVAHEDLGERCAMFIGCSLAVAYAEGLVIADTAAKVVILVLLEVLTDLGKYTIYKASQIEVGRVRFNLHVWAIVAVAFAGAKACTCVTSGIRINCMIGDGVEAILG